MLKSVYLSIKLLKVSNLFKVMIGLLFTLGLINRLRGTYGWFSKVAGVLYGLTIYFIYDWNLLYSSIMLKVFYNFYVFTLFLYSFFGSFFTADYFIIPVDYLFFSSVTVPLLGAIGYVIGEMPGWGLWVGTLTEKAKNFFYLSYEREGGWYTGIQRLAEYLIPPTDANWIKHCTLALFFRGTWWWAFTLIPLLMLDYNIYLFLSEVILLAILFPVACYLGDYTSKKFSIAMMTGGWEHQEVIYGAMQVVVLTSSAFIQYNI